VEQHQNLFHELGYFFKITKYGHFTPTKRIFHAE